VHYKDFWKNKKFGKIKNSIKIKDIFNSVVGANSAGEV
jgi:hypothetical protein